MDREMDPFKLFKALRDTHTAVSIGAKQLDASRARTKYQLLKQGEKESLVAFKNRMDTLLKSLEALGMDIPTDEEQAADLICKVNSHFAPAAKKIEDQILMSGQGPKTTFEAFKLITELSADKTFTASGNTTFNTIRADRPPRGNYVQNKPFNASNDQDDKMMESNPDSKLLELITEVKEEAIHYKEKYIKELELEIKRLRNKE
jgi:hypothetical protein